MGERQNGKRTNFARRFVVDAQKLREAYADLYIFEMCREIGITRAVWDRIVQGKTVSLATARKIKAVCPDAVREITETTKEG